VKTKRTALFIGETGVISLRVKPLEKTRMKPCDVESFVAAPYLEKCIYHPTTILARTVEANTAKRNTPQKKKNTILP
jgi:hypothetical protein